MADAGLLVRPITSLILTLCFGLYAANIGKFDATYGSLGAIVATLTWLYLSSYLLLFGAELNAECEHQMVGDTTTADAPLGKRGAWVADHVVETGLDRETQLNTESAMPVEGSSGIGLGNVVASRGGAIAARMVGLPRVGWMPSIAATVGLSLMRRGRPLGAGLLIGGASMAMWAFRRRDIPGSPLAGGLGRSTEKVVPPRAPSSCRA